MIEDKDPFIYYSNIFAADVVMQRARASAAIVLT